MAPTPHPLRSLGDFEGALTRSFLRPVLIFKHSSTCGVSAMAREEIAALLSGLPIAADVYVVVVQTHRPVSKAIADTLCVRHESPQVLLIDKAEVVWQASHFRVSAHKIRDAVEQVRLAPSPATVRHDDRL